MKSIRSKTYKIVLAISMATGLFQELSAQFVTVPTTISTPRGNVTIPTKQYIPQYYNTGNMLINRKHVFTITFLNDSTTVAKTWINLEDSVHSLVWSKKDVKYYVTPSQTKEISRIGTNGQKLTGFPFEGCWLFPVAKGQINTFSITSETDYPRITHIKKENNTQILLLTKENLLPLINDNQKVIKLVENGKLLRAIELYNKK